MYVLPRAYIFCRYSGEGQAHFNGHYTLFSIDKYRGWLKICPWKLYNIDYQSNNTPCVPLTDIYFSFILALRRMRSVFLLFATLNKTLLKGHPPKKSHCKKKPPKENIHICTLFYFQFVSFSLDISNPCLNCIFRKKILLLSLNLPPTNIVTSM